VPRLSVLKLLKPNENALSRVVSDFFGPHGIHGQEPLFMNDLLSAIGMPRVGAWIMMRSATDLSKADLHVFPKLFDDGLERGQEAKAFSWRQIGGHDDVLEFLVGHLINVEMTRQPAP